jgi:uncharacterized protein YbjT (DUF2867 family)
VIDMGANGGGFRLPSALIQPISAADVSDILAELALGAASNDTVEIAGPEQFGLDEIARMHLAAAAACPPHTSVWRVASLAPCLAFPLRAQPTRRIV